MPRRSSCRLLPGGDRARGSGASRSDVVDGAAEEPPAAWRPRARGAEDDELGVAARAPRRRSPGRLARARSEPRRPPRRRSSRRAPGASSSSVVGLGPPRSGSCASSGSASGTSITCDDRDGRAARRRAGAAATSASSLSPARHDGHDDRPVLDASATGRDEQRRRGRSRAAARATTRRRYTPVEDEARPRASRGPPSAPAAYWTTTTSQAIAGAEPADDGEERPVDAADPEVRAGAVRAPSSGGLRAQRDHRRRARS